MSRTRLGQAASWALYFDSYCTAWLAVAAMNKLTELCSVYIYIVVRYSRT